MHSSRLSGCAGPKAPPRLAVMIRQSVHELSVATRGRGFYEITDVVSSRVRDSRIRSGLATLQILHTSASLLIQENADPDVQVDLLRRLDWIAPRNAGYVHDCEGPDDMPAHIKSMVTETSIAIPVQNGRMVLGTWQGLYVAEHRDRPHRRELVLHFLGEIGAAD